jgi:hypothetical protein
MPVLQTDGVDMRGGTVSTEGSRLTLNAKCIPCQCAFCERHRHIDAVKSRGNVEGMRILLDSLWNDLCETDADLDYHQEILDGSWPSAAEQAQKILERVAARNTSVIKCLDQPNEK